MYRPPRCNKTVTAALPIHCGTFPLLTGTPDQHREAVGETDVQAIELKPQGCLNVQLGWRR